SAVRCSARRVRPTIGDVEFLAVAARVEPVATDASRDEVDLLEAVAIHDIDAIGVHIGHIETRAIGWNPNGLRHSLLWKVQIAQHLMVDEVDLCQPTAAEFAGEDRVTPVYREISVIYAGALRRGDGLL